MKVMVVSQIKFIGFNKELIQIKKGTIIWIDPYAGLATYTQNSMTHCFDIDKSEYCIIN